MDNRPLVSVCIPTYNGAHLVPRAIESCLKQTYNNIEILVIDDCSKDNTIEVVKEYQKISDKIRLIVNKMNLGCSKNFLKTFLEAQGFYVQHLGQDDWLDENFIEEKINIFNSNPNIAFVAHVVKSYISKENGGIVYVGKNCKKNGMQTLQFILKRFYKEPGWFGFSSMMRKKDAVEQYIFDIPNKFGYEKYYAKSMAIDNILLLRILSLPEYDGKFFYTTSAFYNTLSHPEHYSKNYGWVREGNIEDRVKFSHIDRIGYEFFFKTQPKKYLLYYRVYMGYFLIGNIIFDYISKRATTGFSFRAFKFYFSDYSLIEKLAVCLGILPHVVIRAAKWLSNKITK
jgi:glycosyltransferase involved in cell wall biosynthesis